MRPHTFRRARSSREAVAATVVALTAAALVVTLGGCTATSPVPVPSLSPLEQTATGMVGIALPASDDPEWAYSADMLAKFLADAGVTTDVQRADSVDIQASQIDAFVDEEVDVILVAPVDGATLDSELARAEAAGIPIVAYDRALYDTTHVDYFVSVDKLGLAVETAKYVVANEGSDPLAAGPTVDHPVSVEVFGPDLADWDYYFFYNGVMQIGLKSYLDTGAVVVGSGQSSAQDVATVGGAAEAARDRMSELLETTYADGAQLDAVIVASDDIAAGVRSALAEGGREDVTVVGDGNDLETMRAVGDGTQAASVFYDSRELARKAAGMTVDLLNGVDPEYNNGNDYWTPRTLLRTATLWPTVVTKETMNSVLVGSGYFSADELGSGG